MDCRNLRENLSAFVDEQLTPDEKKAVQEHLDRCPDCVTHLEEIRKGIELVRGHEGVEPPSWFARKVMSKVREEAGRNRGILRKLFYPLHIKIPLEAAATVAIVVTAFYVLRTVQPEVRVQRPVSKAELSVPADRYESLPGQGEEMRSSIGAPPAVHDDILPEPPEESGAERRTFAETYKSPVSREQAGEQQRFKAFAGKSEEADKPVILPDEKKAPKSAFRELDMEEKGKTEGVVPSEAEHFIQLKKREYTFTLFAGNIQNSLKTLKATIEKMDGVIIKEEALDNGTIIISEMDAGRLSSFRESLVELGSLEEKKLVEGVSRTVRVRVQILQSSMK